LHDEIFWFKTGAQGVCETSDLMKTIPQVFDTRRTRAQGVLFRRPHVGGDVG
jgi:hypothetical protein